MPLTTNQTELKSYAVALKPGKAHTARWEYLTGPDGWEDIDKATGEEYRAVLQVRTPYDNENSVLLTMRTILTMFISF